MTLTRWRVSLDRRKGDLPRTRDALSQLAQHVHGLHVALDPEPDFWAAPDAGTFRDFVPVATLAHSHELALELAAEWLLERFGWLVDLAPLPHEDPTLVGARGEQDADLQDADLQDTDEQDTGDAQGSGQ